jgi:hypothetical protein
MCTPGSSGCRFLAVQQQALANTRDQANQPCRDDLGEGALKRSTMLNKITAGQRDEVSGQMKP